MEKSLFVFLLTLSLDLYVIKSEEKKEIYSKYDNNEYLELFKIPNSLTISKTHLKDIINAKNRIFF